MRIAVAASVSGFEDIVRVLPKSVGILKGEKYFLLKKLMLHVTISLKPL
jgi:hypothetical protein